MSNVAILQAYSRPNSANPHETFLNLYSPAAGNPLIVNLDTGSIGLVVPYAFVHDESNVCYKWAVSTGKTMTRKYEPSGITFTGTIYNLSELYFLDPENNRVNLGTITALVCDPAPHSPCMLGVALGSMPSLPDALLDNAFLNVENASSASPSPQTYSLHLTTSPEYTITVTLGQASEDLIGYSLIPLVANAACGSGFQMPYLDVSVTPPGNASVTGPCQLLMDCGISGMFFHSGSPITGSLLNAAFEISVHDAPNIRYAFTNGTPPTGPGAPAAVMPGGPGPQGQGYVNTGIHFLNVFDYFVDGVNGKMGFRPV